MNRTDRIRLKKAENTLIKYGRDYGDIGQEIENLFHELQEFQDKVLAIKSASHAIRKQKPLTVMAWAIKYEHGDFEKFPKDFTFAKVLRITWGKAPIVRVKIVEVVK